MKEITVERERDNREGDIETDRQRDKYTQTECNREHGEFVASFLQRPSE